MRVLNISVASIIITMLSVTPADAAEASNGINWSVTPYIWATETKFDLTAQGTPIGEGKIKFDDLLDTTDASFQIVVEAGREGGHWSGFVDATYLDSSDKYTGQLLRIETDSEQWFVDAAIAWWPWSEAGGFNVFAGVRYTDLDDAFDVDLIAENEQLPLAEFGAQRDFLDALLGARYRIDLSQRFSISTKADYGFGDSDGIFLAQVVLQYAIGNDRRHKLCLGYRYKEAELDQGGLEENYDYKGPLIGFNFRF